MDGATLALLLAILALLFISGFFSGSETALTAASRARLHRLVQEGNKRARTVQALLERKERLIGGILLGNNLVNILASALATSLLIATVGEEGVVYATLIMTLLVLIFAEVLPKTYAIANPDRAALAVGPIIAVVITLFGPIVALVSRIVRLTLKGFGIDLEGREAVLTAHEEIRGTIEFQAYEGGIRKAHRDMLGSILDLDELTVEDVMVHRRHMKLLDINTPTPKLIAQAVRAPYTRIPLYRDHVENIVGVLHAKDLLRAVLRTGGDASKIDITQVMVKPWFVPETTSLRAQMNAFRSRRAHFALVVDEYGTLMGLVTLEDILEEIVGDITDEHDVKVEGVKVEPDGAVLVDGTVPIRDLNREFDWTLPDENAATIAGLVIYEAETLPIVGHSFQFHDFAFEILGRKRNQITQLRMRKLEEAGAVEAD